MTNSSRPTALVTGASSGIGQAIAARLAQEDYRVFGTSRHNLADGTVRMIRLDVTDQRSVDAATALVLAETGRIDVLVNNAGFALLGALEDSTMAQAQAIFDTNLFGVMRMTRAVLPHMRAAGAGRIVNIGSVSGFLPGPFSGLYAATKHALAAYSESLDHELRTLGIRSTVIEPAFTRSNIAAAMPAPDAPLAVYAPSRANIAAAFEAALAKGSDPAAVAAVVVRALADRDPQVRYKVGRDAALLSRLRRWLPAKAFERSFRKQFRLDQVKPLATPVAPADA